MTTSEPLSAAEGTISVQGVTRAYGEVLAVDDVSFSVSPGEVVGLLGPNGAGKTTTMRMIASLLQPDSGAVSVCGFDTRTHAMHARGKLGYQTGDTGLYGRLTPREFLTYFGKLQGMPKAEIQPKVAASIASFQMGEYADRQCSTLSTGQKQRVTLARTLLHDPPVVVLDEPTSGLDIVSSSFMLQALTRAAEDGRAVLLSTHILSEVELICDRILVMDRGKIVARGTVAELCEQCDAPNLTRAFLSLVSTAVQA